jgi:hypothetical protein
VKIYDSTFQSNTAVGVSAWVTISKTFLKFLPCPGAGHIQLLGRRGNLQY